MDRERSSRKFRDGAAKVFIFSPKFQRNPASILWLPSYVADAGSPGCFAKVSRKFRVNFAKVGVGT